MTESELLKRFLGHASKNLRNVRLWRRNVGAVELADGRYFKTGVPGQADVTGFTREGRAIEIEFKSAKGKRTPEQIAWGTMCLAWSVIYLEMRPLKGETLEETLDRWTEELREAIDGKRAA